MSEKEAPPKKTIPGWLNFVFGGAAGMCGNAIVQPMDMIKTRMQLMGPAKNVSMFGVARDIIRKDGPLGLYNGLSAALFRQATYTTARLGVFNVLMDKYKEHFGISPNLGGKLMIGVIAGGIGAFVGTPAEVCLIRMTADGRLPPQERRNYKHVFNALSRIIKDEGVTTLWRGAIPTVTRAMVVNGAQLGTYAQAREALMPRLGEGIFLHFCASMISGLITTAASQPLDIVKTRVQQAQKGTSQVRVFMEIVKKEGVLALWRGFVATYFKIGPHTVLTFIFLEQFNAFYLRL